MSAVKVESISRKKIDRTCWLESLIYHEMISRILYRTESDVLNLFQMNMNFGWHRFGQKLSLIFNQVELFVLWKYPAKFEFVDW